MFSAFSQFQLNLMAHSLLSLSPGIITRHWAMQKWIYAVKWNNDWNTCSSISPVLQEWFNIKKEMSKMFTIFTVYQPKNHYSCIIIMFIPCIFDWNDMWYSWLMQSRLQQYNVWFYQNLFRMNERSWWESIPAFKRCQTEGRCVMHLTPEIFHCPFPFPLSDYQIQICGLIYIACLLIWRKCTCRNDIQHPPPVSCTKDATVTILNPLHHQPLVLIIEHLFVYGYHKYLIS